MPLPTSLVLPHLNIWSGYGHALRQFGRVKEVDLDDYQINQFPYELCEC